MKTLEEIQKIIFPVKEKIDMKEVAKDLIIQKFGKNKLISFEYVELDFATRDSFRLHGLAVVDDRLLVLVDEYSRDYPMGTYFSNVANGEHTFDRQYGIGVTDEVLMKACQNLFNEKEIHVEFNFQTMTSPDSWQTYLSELIEDIESGQDKEVAENARKIIQSLGEVARGEITGYIKFMEGELVH